VAWVAEVVEGTPIGVVLGTVEETVEGGEVVCTVVLVVVEEVTELAHEAKIKDITMRTVSTIQTIPLFIVSSFYSVENIWQID